MRKLVGVLAAIFLLIIAAEPIMADWTIDDGYKMHFPQLPDSVGWNVRATFPYVLADDWTCSQTGWVSDIHFWGSWVNGVDGEIVEFELSIHADIPANPPEVPYSRPGEELWKRVIPFPQFIIAPVDGLSWQGWYDPVTGWYNLNDHQKYYQYNVFLDTPDWFWQEEGTVYWLNISATVLDPQNTQWGWKSSINHHQDDAVWAEMPIYNWVDLWEPPEFTESLDLAFVITSGPDEIGACCYPDPVGAVGLTQCVETTLDDCINNYNGVWEGPGTMCGGMEACCLSDGTCLDADTLCCVRELGGVPQGAGTSCGVQEACCLPDGSCVDADPLCCVNELGGIPQGPGTTCTKPEACCLGDGSCIDVDPLCCDEMGGVAQGPGTGCSAATIACCLPTGACLDVDPLCCDDMGGVPSPVGAAACLGDSNGNGTDDACETLGACCWTDGTCTMETNADCVTNGGDYKGDGISCLSDINGNGMDDICEDLWPGHKMHYPQLPDEAGWDVYATSTGDQAVNLADDWMCTETGWVKDIHFWGSWKGGLEAPILVFALRIWSNIPAEDSPTGYSMPGDILWEKALSNNGQPITSPTPEGWYDPTIPEVIPNDHHTYYRYDFYLDSLDWFWQEEGNVYWLSIVCVHIGPSDRGWGWKSSRYHFMDDAVWGMEGVYDWIDIWEPPDYTVSLDLAFVITSGVQPTGACCYPPAAGGSPSLCTVTTQDSCINVLGGVYEGDGSVCQGMEACCLPDGSCIDADALCCINELGGIPQGPGTMCTQPEACCLSDGSCIDVDPLCCDEMGGTPQGVGTNCSGTTIACCLPDGSCVDVEPLCCDDLGGKPSPIGATACLGDSNGNGTDDACEKVGACCWSDGSCTMETEDYCVTSGGDYKGDGINCLGDINGNSIDDVCEDLWPGHKMHYPQLPDEAGWDVYATSTGDPSLAVNLADDWMCTETGWVKDLHFWGSWKGGLEAPILAFALRIWSNIPAEESQTGFSMPGDILWEKALSPVGHSITSPTPEGWYNPALPEVIPDDHMTYYRYDLYLDSLDWFWQTKDSVYWLSIICVHMGSSDRAWGWKSSRYHFMDDAVWGLEGEFHWRDIWEPPDYTVSMDLAFVITSGVQPTGACCYENAAGEYALCTVTTQDSCINVLGGHYEGDGTVCAGMQACCLSSGLCIDADSICCVNELGGLPQGPGTACGPLQACCLPDNSCADLDSLCCLELGGVPLGTGTHCTAPEACCMSDGSCAMLDPLCCDNMGGKAQGPGTNCSPNTIACCLPAGTCIDTDPLCCDDLGGVPSPWGSPVCLGDLDGNGIDDACEIDTCTYYKPPYEDYAPVGMPDFDQKQDAWMVPGGFKWSWCGPTALANCIWWFDSKFELATSPPPPAMFDSYPLVSSYGPWDDHDPNNVMPFIQALAPMCNTDVIWQGTVLYDLEAGFINWVGAAGLAGHYTTYVIEGPEFEEVRDSIDACQDVILLLGFYEVIPGGGCQWIGGHYVTAAGTCVEETALCVSDPMFDGNEGEPPAGSAHGSAVHNDAQFVSGPHGTIHHDKYRLAPVSIPICPSPAQWEFVDYPNNWPDIMVFENENPITPPPTPGIYNGGEIIVLLDAALIICPAEPCDCIPGDANNDGDVNVGDAVYIIAYVFKGGPPPVPYRICSGDANCDCQCNVGDAVYVISYVFKGGPPPCDCPTWLSICGPPLRK